MTRIIVSELVSPDLVDSGLLEYPDGVQRHVSMRCSQWSALVEIIDTGFMPLAGILQLALEQAADWPLPEGEEFAIRQSTADVVETLWAGMRAERGDHANINDPRLNGDVARLIEGN
jgi:hypothetical protein